MTSIDNYDVIVVGSGAGGGMAAYELTRQGLTVLMLEAGRDYDPISETPMFNTPEEAPLHAARTPEKPFDYYDATVGGGWSVPGEPYTIKSGSDEFAWFRPRMLGGRTNHWGRISLRFGPYDFKSVDRDGLGFNWPLDYDDLHGWYDKTEDLIGVTGENLGLENTPDSSPGILHDVPAMRANEIFFKHALDELDIPVAGIRKAVLTRPHKGRDACFFATHCKRGCSIRANFQSTTVLIPPAMETGRLTVLTDAMVYTVDQDDSGKATGVTYVDRQTRARRSVTAKTVVLAAGACETARIMLNSNIANSSGLVGKFIMDTVGLTVVAQFPALEGLPHRNDDGMTGAHIYVPWWGYQQQAAGALDFPRGYHIELNGGANMPDVNIAKDADLSGVPFGQGLRDSMRKTFGSFLKIVGRGEMIPNDDCYLEIDPDIQDKWGIPVARFNWKWSEHETRQAAHMVKTFHGIVDRLGGQVISGHETDGAKAILAGGKIIHEVGGARMGDDPSTSVTNQYGQCWDVNNLFVMDGAVFPTNPDKNPTLSILALAMRSSEYLAQEARKGAFG